MAVDCSVTGHEDGLTATLTGRLGMADVAKLRTGLFKCLAEQPDALFVDLAGLSVEEPLALAVFSAVSRQAARWPGIPVLFYAATDVVRRLLVAGVHRRLPVFVTLGEARERAHADGQSLPSPIDDLVPLAGAARQARNVATEACLRWDLPDLVGSASLIASELGHQRGEPRRHDGDPADLTAAAFHHDRRHGRLDRRAAARSAESHRRARPAVGRGHGAQLGMAPGGWRQGRLGLTRPALAGVEGREARPAR
jgi:hypothetical protein